MLTLIRELASNQLMLIKLSLFDRRLSFTVEGHSAVELVTIAAYYAAACGH